MRARILFPCTLGLLVLAGQVFAEAPADLEQRVRRFVEDANRRDIEAVLAQVTPGFRWMEVEEDRVRVEVVGREQLRSWLEGYFRTTPGARSSLGEVIVDGAFVSAVEVAEYPDASGTLRRQASTSVYQFNPDGLIRNVWYFPARELAAAASPAQAP